MARGRLRRRWRRWSQFTAGLSTAAKNREITSQPTNVRTCHSRNSATSTTTTVSRAAATVRTTCEVGAPAHPTSLLIGTGAAGRVGVVSGFAGLSGCESLCGVESFCGVFSSSISLASTDTYRETLWSLLGIVHVRVVDAAP